MAGKGKEINITLGKNIQLLGFDILEPSEMAIVNDLMQNYVKKIDNKTEYDLLKLKLKMHQHSKTFIHELEAELFLRPGVSLGTEVSHKNLYKGIAMAMKKILSEIDHYKKHSPRERPIKKLSRKIL